MPNPKKNETKDEFISRFMSSDEAKRDFPDNEQRLAVAFSKWREFKKSKKEIRPCSINISLKEKDNEYYSEGFIATTHPDRASDPQAGVVGDVLSKNVLKQIAEFINETVATIKGIGSTRTVSLQHDWVKEGNPDLVPAGMAMPPAEVRETGDGHFGVYVKTHHNKNHPEFKEILYNVEHGYLPGYSIEYEPGDSELITVNDQPFRFLKSITNFVGYAFASARKIANPSAVITTFGYKEIEEKMVNNTNNLKYWTSEQEGHTHEWDEISDYTSENSGHKHKIALENMTAEFGDENHSHQLTRDLVDMKETEVKDQITEEKEVQEMVEQTEIKEEDPKQELKESDVEATEVKETEEEESEEKIEEDVSEDEGEEAIEEKEVKSKEVDVKDAVKEIIKSPEYKEAVDSVKLESKALNTGTMEENQMNIRIKEMNDSLVKGDLVSAKEAGLQFIRENEDFYVKAIQDPKHYSVGFKSNLNIKAVGKGLKIMGGVQVKGTLDSSSNASTYTQQPVEFADVFAPGILDTFNNQTNLFGFLEKENHPGGTAYQWKMVINKDPDSNNTFVDFDDVTVAKNFSDKNNYQTPIKVARRGVSVADTTLRYSTQSLGDLFQLELDLQMKEMMNDVETALFAEVADGTNNNPLGLEAVADSAGNTTLYGFTRSTANRLSPDSAGDTYTAVGGSLTEALMRTKMSYLETEGVLLGRMAIVASPTSRDYLLNLLDGQRRFNTTEATFGFNKMMVASYDGVPIIISDKCNSDAIFIIDRDSDKIIMAMEPRIVSLAKVGAATEAYVEMHFAHVYKQPRRIGMLDTLSGP